MKPFRSYLDGIQILSQGSASEATKPVPEPGLASQAEATPKPSSNNGSKLEATRLDVQDCQ